MKVPVVKLKTAAVLIVFAVGSITGFAQVKTVMYVFKNGEVVFESSISDIDNVTFDKAGSGDALIVHKNDGSSANKILLNDIQQLSFSDENLLVETPNGSEMYAFGDIAKLLFGDSNATGINDPPARRSLDVLVYVTPAGDVTVESPSAIRSLTLFDVAGRTISVERCNAAAVETLHATSLQGRPTGIYLLRVETEQGTVVKKAVKPSNK